jgi:hypothetical protein
MYRKTGGRGRRLGRAHCISKQQYVLTTSTNLPPRALFLVQQHKAEFSWGQLSLAASKHVSKVF